MLLQVMGFMEGRFPFNYLGVPIVSSRLLSAHFEDMVSKIRDQLERWKARLLSSGARLLLLKHVLQSISVHCFSIM